MARTVYEVQLDFALSSGLRSSIIWDSLDPKQGDILKQKIDAIIPDTGKNKNALAKMRINLFENVWQQRKYTNRMLLSSIIYVMVADEKNNNLAKQSTTYSCHPVFRTRKCLNSNNSAGCCMIFIDEHSRVYNNWKQYVENNVLPKGIMIAPANGVYTFNDNDQVNLEFHFTPMASQKSKILNTTDTVAGIGGFVANVPLIAAIATPIAAPVLLAATAVTITAATYATVRSAMQLSDRSKHDQSIALTDSAARNNWLGVAGGVIGIGSMGATKALTTAAAVGSEIAMATKVAVNSINVTSILLSGSSIANRVFDLYMKISDDEKISKMDVLELSASLIVFTHSINNFKIASNVATNTRGASMRLQLEKYLRNTFDRIFRETLNLGGGTGNVDIIRTVNDVPLKEVLMNLHKINLHLTRGKAAIGTAGSILLPSGISSFNNGNNGFSLLKLAQEFGNKFVEHIGNTSSLIDVLNAMTHYFCKRVVQLLMNLAKTFIEIYVDAIDKALSTFVSTEKVLYKILMEIVKNYTDFSYDFLEKKTAEILNFLDKYFESLNPINYSNKMMRCSVCKGNYFICNL